MDSKVRVFALFVCFGPGYGAMSEVGRGLAKEANGLNIQAGEPMVLVECFEGQVGGTTLKMNGLHPTCSQGWEATY